MLILALALLERQINFFRGQMMRRCLFLYRLLWNQYRTGMSNSYCVSACTPNMVCTGTYLPHCNKAGSYRGQKNVSWVCSDFSYFHWEMVCPWQVSEGEKFSAVSFLCIGCTACTIHLQLLTVQENTCQIWYLCGRGCGDGGSGPATRVPAVWKCSSFGLLGGSSRWKVVSTCADWNFWSMFQVLINSLQHSNAAWWFGCYFWQVGDPFYKNMSEALGNSRSSALTAQLWETLTPCPARDKTSLRQWLLATWICC